MTGWSIQRKTVVAFGAVILVLLALIAATHLTTESFLKSSASVSQSMQAIAAQERIYSSLTDMMWAQRAYVTNTSQAQWSARTAARDRLVEQSALLTRTPFANAPEQKARIDSLRTSIAAAISLMDDVIAARESGNVTLTRLLEFQSSGARLLTQIRSTLDEISAFERARIDSYEKTSELAAFKLYGAIALVGTIFLIGFSWLFWRIYADLETRDAISQRLEQTNTFLESLLENIPTMVFVKDAQALRFVRFNKAGEQLLGYPRTDLIGKNDRDFFPQDQADFFIDKDREVLMNGKVADIPEEEIDTRQHGRRILHTRKVPLFDVEGQPSLLLGISMDITEQKLVEREVRKLNEDLRLKAEALIAANQELESFCYSVSHDLRAPLRAIHGYSSLLIQDHAPTLDTDAKRLLKAIGHNSEHMAELIDDLLEFSRLGRQAFARSSVDMTELAMQAASDVLQGVAQPKISIQPLPQVRGDPRALHHVWLNLLDNAVKYSANAAAPAVSVWAESGDEEIVYSVRDNGIGFDMQYYDKLFGVFERLHSPKEYPGTGVGLAIVKRVVSRHGGRVWAESTPGRGATFRFSLPLVENASVKSHEVEPV